MAADRPPRPRGRSVRVPSQRHNCEQRRHLAAGCRSRWYARIRHARPVIFKQGRRSRRLPVARALPPARNGEPGLSRLLGLAQRAQVGCEVVGRGEGVGMVVTQHPGGAGRGCPRRVRGPADTRPAPPPTTGNLRLRIISNCSEPGAVPGCGSTPRCGGTIGTMVALMRRGWTVVAAAAVLALAGATPASAKSKRPEGFGKPVYHGRTLLRRGRRRGQDVRDALCPRWHHAALGVGRRAAACSAPPYRPPPSRGRRSGGRDVVVDREGTVALSDPTSRVPQSSREPLATPAPGAVGEGSRVMVCPICARD